MLTVSFPSERETKGPSLYHLQQEPQAQAEVRPPADIILLRFLHWLIVESTYQARIVY